MKHSKQNKEAINLAYEIKLKWHKQTEITTKEFSTGKKLTVNKEEAYGIVDKTLNSVYVIIRYCEFGPRFIQSASNHTSSMCVVPAIELAIDRRRLGLVREVKGKRYKYRKKRAWLKEKPLIEARDFYENFADLSLPVFKGSFFHHYSSERRSISTLVKFCSIIKKF